MALGDMFKSKENEQLRARIQELESLLTPDMHRHLNLKQLIQAQQHALNELRALSAIEEQNYSSITAQHQSELNRLIYQINEAKEILVETNEQALMQSFGMYTPRYAFANSTLYKDRLANIRSTQKELIKSGYAATGNTNWTVNGDPRQGQKMISDLQKLLIRCFNSECDDVVEHVKFNNIDASEKRIDTCFSMISKLGSVCGVAITENYRNLKLQELFLAYEYQIAKQAEKEALKQLRAEERERAKLEKEIAEARRKIEKEQKHYTNALIKLNEQILSSAENDLPNLLEKKAELEQQLTTLDASMNQIDYREANQKAGYVYIISNIGAFGEDVYKIGMTRRLVPMERIDELGDASVPFDFDVHALIFSNNAPALEAALHKAFEDKKLNLVNHRREFFKVSLEEIKAVVKANFDQTVDFVDIPPAEQFRQTKLMRQK